MRDIAMIIHRVQAALPITDEERAVVNRHLDECLRSQRRFIVICWRIVILLWVIFAVYWLMEGTI